MMPLWIIVVVNAVFTATPPYGWMTVLNGLCVLAGLVMIATENSR